MDKTDSGVDAGCPHLLRALMRARPLLHCFGHIHEGWGAEFVNWSDADRIATETASIAEWKDGKYVSGMAPDNGVRPVPVDAAATTERHAAYLDMTSNGERITPGEQTALINAAIMDVKYRPVNAPWLVDMDLPSRS